MVEVCRRLPSPSGVLVWLCRVLQRRYRDCQVLVYGSALSELATPTSDIDLCLNHPASEREARECEAALKAARDEITELTEKVVCFSHRLLPVSCCQRVPEF